MEPLGHNSQIITYVISVSGWTWIPVIDFYGNRKQLKNKTLFVQGNVRQDEKGKKKKKVLRHKCKFFFQALVGPLVPSTCPNWEQVKWLSRNLCLKLI